MTDTGTVSDVTRVDLGSQLATAVTHGATTLYVNDAADFVEGWLVRAGVDDQAPDTEAEQTHEITTVTGFIRVGGDIDEAEILRYIEISEPDDEDDDDEDELIGLAESAAGIGGGYGGAQFYYRDNSQANPRAVDDGDTEPATITLDPSTPIAHPGGWPADTRVDVWDITHGEPAAEWRALVRPDSDVDNTEAVDALVAYSIVPFMHEGVRSDDQAESVILDDTTGEWTVTNITGRPPRLDGGYIVGGTIRNTRPLVDGIFGGYYEEVTLPAQPIPSHPAEATHIGVPGHALTSTRLLSDYGDTAWDLETGVWTAPANGVYVFHAGVRFQAWTADSPIALFLLAGGVNRDEAFAAAQTLAQDPVLTLTGTRWCAGGDTVAVNVRQTSGQQRSIDHTNPASHIKIRRVA